MADKLLSTVLGFARALPIGTSTGGNQSADSGKALIFNASGGITGSSATATPGVFGTGTFGEGVSGTSTSGAGVKGVSSSDIGVSGTSTTGTGLFGIGVLGLLARSNGGTNIADFVNGANLQKFSVERATLSLVWTVNFTLKLALPVATSPRTWTLPDASGTIAIDSQVVHINGSEVILGTKTFSGYAESQTVATTTGGGALCTLNINASTFQKITLTASVACVFTMPIVAAGKSFTLMVQQPAATGNASATFTGVQWGSAGAPVITVGAGKMDILTFVSDGVKWYGSYIQGFTY